MTTGNCAIMNLGTSSAERSRIMARKFVECHEKSYPGAPECSAVFTSDSDDELLELAVRHGINVHGHSNTEAYREQVRSEFRLGSPEN